MRTVIQIAIDGLSFGSLYALFALGVALIFGVMNLINFAHGELIMIGGYALFYFGHQPWPLMLAAAIAVVLAFALATERIAFRPVRGANPSTLLVTSFAVSFLLQNLAILIIGTRAKTITLSPALIQSWDIGGFTVSKISVVITATTLALLGSFALFLKKTPLGIQMRAAAVDFPMARLLGVRANTVVATGFALSGFLAAVAAILLVAQIGTLTPTMGLAPVLVAFVATIIGGLGRLGGAVLGGYVLGIVTVILQTTLPLDLRPYRDAFVFGTVIAILVIKPDGLIGSKAAQVRL